MGKEEVTLEKIGAGIEKINERLGNVDKKLEIIDQRFESMDRRFDDVDKSLGRLEIMIGDVDNKFSLITEGQDVIREVLETRVAHIEEILTVASEL